MNRETWKAQERDYAKKIHGKRIPVTGRSGSDVPDITSHTIVGEVKKSGTGKAVSLKTMKALRGISTKRKWKKRCWTCSYNVLRWFYESSKTFNIK